MDNLFLDQLPDNTISLVHEIEDYSGKEIQVLPNPNPISPTDPNPNGPACSVSEFSAKIFYRNQVIDPHGFTHELLHIHRYWVQQIPQILPVNDPDGSHIKITSQIENTLEHLIIVPEETGYGFERFGHWNRTCRLNWETFDPSVVDKFVIRKACILGWLTEANLVNDPEAISIAEKIIKKQGFFKKAKRLNYLVLKHKNSKERQISCVVKFLQIPRNQVKLIYFNPINETYTEREVAKHKE